MENLSGLFEKFRKIVRKPTQSSNPPVKPHMAVPSATDQFKPGYNASDYSNEDALEKEFLSLQEELELGAVGAQKLSGDLESESKQKMDNLSNRISQAINFLNENIMQFEEKVKNNPPSVQDLRVYGALKLGVSLFVADYLDQQRALAKTQDLEPKFDFFLRLSKFRYTGGTSISIAGVSIRDIMNNKKSELSPASTYRLLMESQLLFQNISHEAILKENLDYPQQKYPNITKTHIETGASSITAGFNLPEEKLHPYLSSNSGVAKECVQYAIRFIKQCNILQQKLYATLLNPQSPDFPMLRETAEHYLKGKWIDRMIATHIIGIKNISSAQTLYRKSREMEKTDNDLGPFYQLLTKSLLDYFEAISLEAIKTKDDAIPLLEKGQNGQAQTPPSYEDLATINIRTSLKSSRKKYDIAIKDIKWHTLIPPTQASIEFAEGGPRKFKVNLHYTSPEGEATSLNVNFDTKEQELDWPFLEDPNDPEMKEIRDAIMTATKEILLNVQGRAEREWQNRHATQILQPTTTNSKKQKPEAPYVPREKEEKVEMPKPLTPFQEALQDMTSQSIEAAGIKNHILIPEKEETIEFSQSLSARDRQRIKEGIDAYNKTGVGDFKMLKPLGKNVQKIYKLNINTEGGQVRVLMQEANDKNGNGTRQFKIIAIGYRKDIYRKHGI